MINKRGRPHTRPAKEHRTHVEVDRRLVEAAKDALGLDPWVSTRVVVETALARAGKR